jgi:Na+/proline symporter
MSPATAISIVGAFGLTMLAATMVRRYSRGIELFLVSERSVGTVVGAMSVAASWIWAPALFIAAQKAFQEGIAGLMWFTVPNVGCLVLFAFLARRIRLVFPRGYTLPEYVGKRFDSRTHLVYLFCFLSLQICSMAVQLIAGAAMLKAISGVPYSAGVLLLALVFTSYSLVDGLHSSIRTDVAQLFIIFVGMGVVVPVAVANGGGFAAVIAGLGGFDGTHGSVFDPHVAYTFGITVTIGLMSGPVGDQQHWQRAFAFARGKVLRGYLLGAALFAVVPVTMGLLGFLAAGNHEAAPLVASGAASAQQTAPEVVATLLPWWGMTLYTLIILAGLASTGDSALCAGGSLIAVDVYRRYINPQATEGEMLRGSRFAVLLLGLAAVGVALIPGITILSLFLFYGTLRSSTLMPTIVMLYRKSVPAWGMFWGITLAILVGLPLYLIGELTGNVDLKIVANIGILLVSLFMPLAASRFVRTHT